MPVKQVIILRKDLGMRFGKANAQSGHAVPAFLTRPMKASPGQTEFVVTLSEEQREWLNTGETKISLRVNSEKELIKLYDKAVEKGLTVELVTDSGRTEFNGVATHTCIVIGPNENSKIDSLTKHLQLY